MTSIATAAEEAAEPVRGKKARKLQGFEMHPPRCTNCKHYVPPVHGRPECAEFKKTQYEPPRCGLGWFIVHPHSVCDQWTGKEGDTLQ
jgi:hypothetical protein